MTAWHTKRRPAAALVALAALTPVQDGRAAAIPHRYSIDATASLAAAAQAASGGRFQLESGFQVVAPAPQAGGRYVLKAHVGGLPLVCTPDTIFEDGFDG